mmetsp:Transcript_4205/g.13849  ORF Transcript_4205/g.13849 Transcript_4205/m.13849 type:complete len:301 (+) Transcript_4205:89-991(+)
MVGQVPDAGARGAAQLVNLDGVAVGHQPDRSVRRQPLHPLRHDALEVRELVGPDRAVQRQQHRRRRVVPRPKLVLDGGVFGRDLRRRCHGGRQVGVERREGATQRTPPAAGVRVDLREGVQRGAARGAAGRLALERLNAIDARHWREEEPQRSAKGVGAGRVRPQVPGEAHAARALKRRKVDTRARLYRAGRRARRPLSLRRCRPRCVLSGRRRLRRRRRSLLLRSGRRRPLLWRHVVLLVLGWARWRLRRRRPLLARRMRRRRLRHPARCRLPASDANVGSRTSPKPENSCQRSPSNHQ